MSDSVSQSTKISRINPKTVRKAAESLLKWRNSQSESQKPQLLDEEDVIYLVLSLKKIPSKGRTNPYKIPLPHSLHSELSELCLFVDDRTKSNLTKGAAKEKIQSENIPVSKIIRLSKLKSDFRAFEAKRKLCDSYDMFFADDRVIPLLPSMLGKHFFKKKKIPVPINLRHKNWKEQIEKSCASALLYLRTGTCSVVKVAKTSMEVEEIVSNVLAAIEGIAEIVPKKWGNVRSFHLKVLESIALPIYQSVPDVRFKIESLKVKAEGMEGVSGKSDVKEKKEKKEKVSKKGRIHAVQYMDKDISELSDEDDLGSDVDEVIDDVKVSPDAAANCDELKGKKRNRVDKVKEELGIEMNVEKRLKKSTSSSNKGSVKQEKDKVSAKKKNKESIKQKKGVLSVDDGESAGKKKKGSGVVKLKAGETKVKTKKLKAGK